MIRHIASIVTLGGTCALAGPLATSAFAEEAVPVTVEITEWDVPYKESRPRDPWVGEGNTIWFVGQRSDYVAKFNRETEEFHRIDLEDGAGPHTVVANEDGAWYAGNRAAHIGFIDRETEEITQFPLPGDGPRDVHTFAFDSEGDLWFTVQGGNQIGKMDLETEKMQVWDAETERARPYGILVDDDDQPWIVMVGTNKLATIEDGNLREIDLPREEARPRRIAITDDGNIWYVDYAAGHVGRYDPETEEIEEWETPSGEDSAPYAMASDGEDRLWFVETGPQPNLFVGFDPETESFTAPVEVPSGGGTVRHMVYDAEANAIWFGADTNTIGRADIVTGE
jgi:virginiamycin B lyase